MSAHPALRSVLIAALLACFPAAADWKSFIHGEPAPFVKSPPPKQLAIVSTAPGAPVDAQVESFLRAFATAVMARDAAGLEHRLSERYTVEGAPDGVKPADLLAQAIGKMRGPTEIVVQSITAAGAERVAQVEFRYGGDKANVKTFRFDSGGRLLSSDLFRLERA